jgi:hypothetical protein
METVGFVGVGKIGMPISMNLIKSGYRVVGYRRSSLAEFEKIGGVAVRSPADVGAQADIVFSCMPSPEALDEVMQGRGGLVNSAPPGQILFELGLVSGSGQSTTHRTTRRERRELFDRFVAMGLSDCDGAAMIDVIGSMPRETSKTSIPKRGREQTTMESSHDPGQQDRTRHL